MASPRLDKDTFKLLKSQREKLELLLLFPHDPKDKWPKWLAVFYAIEQGKKKGLDDDQIFDKTRLLEAVGHVDADTFDGALRCIGVSDKTGFEEEEDTPAPLRPGSKPPTELTWVDEKKFRYRTDGFILKMTSEDDDELDSW